MARNASMYPSREFCGIEPTLHSQNATRERTVAIGDAYAATIVVISTAVLERQAAFATNGFTHYSNSDRHTHFP